VNSLESVILCLPLWISGVLIAGVREVEVEEMETWRLGGAEAREKGVEAREKGVEAREKGVEARDKGVEAREKGVDEPGS
jgi:hypothetical protein